MNPRDSASYIAAKACHVRIAQEGVTKAADFIINRAQDGNYCIDINFSYVLNSESVFQGS